LSAIGAAPYSIGIPKDSVIQYEAALTADEAFGDGARHRGGKGAGKGRLWHGKPMVSRCAFSHESGERSSPRGRLTGRQVFPGLTQRWRKE